MPRTLEEKPLLRQIALVASGLKTDLVLGVILLNKVLDDGTRFPNGKASVGVLNGGHTAIGVDREVGLLLQFWEADVVNLIRQAEFFQKHDDLWRVGPCLAIGGDGLEGRHFRSCENDWFFVDSGQVLVVKKLLLL